jgi:hypothetical protein
MPQQLAAAVAAAAALAGCGAGTDAYEVATADVTLPPPPLCLAVVRGAWHAPVRIDGGGTTFTIRPHVATSRGGTAVAAWLQSAPNHTWNVVASRNQSGLFTGITADTRSDPARDPWCG